MSKDELLVLRKSLDDLVQKGYIRPSNSEVVTPVLFVRKPGGGLRFCYDYRTLNAITKLDQYLLLLIPETLRNLSGANQLTKVDVVLAFYQIRVAKGHEHKTAFRTRFGSFEQLVCLFGLSRVLATFQQYINSLLRTELDDFVLAYIDNIIIYTNRSKEDHFLKVRQVLQKLQDRGLFLDLGKSEFTKKTIKYLRFIIHTNRKGVSSNLIKVEAIRNQETPKSQKEVKRFLRFTNYYRIFILDYSGITSLLTVLTGKSIPFSKGKIEEDTFQRLKKRFYEALVLAHQDLTLQTFLEADYSSFTLGDTLLQEKNRVRRPVGFFSQKLNKAEINYDIHNKEILAIVSYLKFQTPKLKTYSSFTIQTDYKNLEYFMTKRQLTERQIRQYKTISLFQFTLVYRLGSKAIVPDTLSRREQDILGEEDRESRQYRILDPDYVLNQPESVDKKEIQIASTSLAELVKLQVHERLVLDSSTKPRGLFQDSELNILQGLAAETDLTYKSALCAVQNSVRSFPNDFKLKV